MSYELKNYKNMYYLNDIFSIVVCKIKTKIPKIKNFIMLILRFD